MCTGLEIAALASSAALSAGSQIMNQQYQQDSQNRAIAAKNEATAANLKQLQPIQQDAQDQLQQSVSKFGPTTQAVGMAQAAQARSAAADDAVKSAPTYQSPISSGSKGRAAQLLSSAVGQGNIANTVQNNANSALRAYGDQNQANQISTARYGANIARDASAAQGIASLLPIQQQAAINNTYQPPSMWGPALGLAGTGLSLGLAGGAFSPGGGIDKFINGAPGVGSLSSAPMSATDLALGGFNPSYAAPASRMTPSDMSLLGIKY